MVGQVEMIRDPEDLSAGKVNLFYLRPDCRGLGLGGQLERYALDCFQGVGLSEAWLRVSASNRRALAFYAKQGWRDAGPDVRFDGLRVMRKGTA
ncbi:GNAT family N-acetyltransferase [Pelomonas sp. BJYL3]|uniref:GNAT family N-acetyltransferase n=1 Tax=Pelomonas sp. BJYL3 TaxID=2976697 RepID=UPI003FA79FF2